MRGRSRQPRHRRRRWAALAAGLLLIVVLLVTIGMVGGGAPGRAGRRGHGGGGSSRGRAGRGPGALSGLSTSAEAARESAAIDRTLSYTPYVRIAGAQHRELALTFDDGPGPYTTELLHVLRDAHAPATFFEIGILERYFHSSTSAILAAGDPIEDHTFSHAPMSQLSPKDQSEQILQDADVLGSYGDPFPRLFRPPYGLFNPETLKLLRRFRMLMVLWSVDTEDYRRPGVETIIHRALAGARPGAIILMHDAGGNRSETVAALPRLIAALRARGYVLVTVPRLLLDNPAPATQDLSALKGSGG